MNTDILIDIIRPDPRICRCGGEKLEHDLYCVGCKMEYMRENQESRIRWTEEDLDRGREL